MVKILCLHGVGTNSDILRTQLASIRAFLPNHYEWHFVDGELESTPAPGVEGVFPPPFLSYHFMPSCEVIQDVVELIDDVIETEGPFDAVLGFSQGGAMAATMIIRHQILRPFEPPPFRIAFLFCGNLPWSWTPEQGTDVKSLLLRGRIGSVDFEEWKEAAASKPPAENTEAYLNGMPEWIRQQGRETANKVKQSGVPELHRFHPEGWNERITIPSVHVYGLKDDYEKQSLKLVELFDPNLAQVIQQPGGHEITRDRDLAKTISDAIQRAVTRADLMM